jgi:hypothetical protein
VVQQLLAGKATCRPIGARVEDPAELGAQEFLLLGKIGPAVMHARRQQSFRAEGSEQPRHRALHRRPRDHLIPGRLDPLMSPAMHN